MRAWSLRRRLTSLVVAVVASVLVLHSLFLYLAARDAAWQQHDTALLSRARAIAASVEYDDDEGFEIALPQEPGTYVEAWRPDGTVLARSRTLADDDLRGELALDRDPAFADVTLLDGNRGRAIGMRVPTSRDPRSPRSVLLVLADHTDDVDAAIAHVRTWAWLLATIAIAAVAVLTAWSVARGMRPLARLGRELERIDDRRLASQLTSADQPVELRTPVRKLEELLARLDASLSRERQFSADVSHELRTPLAGLRTVLEVTRLADRSAAEYRAAIAAGLEIVEQLANLVENLLALARAEAGQLELAPSDVALRSLVDDCWAPYAEAANARGITFRNEVAIDRRQRIDREHLRIVLANLLSNAAAYTERGGWIEVRSGDGEVLEVSDSGPPIAANQLDRIFERLWRGDAARTDTGVHCGIGLALSRAICARMQLALTVTSSAERVVFRVG